MRVRAGITADNLKNVNTEIAPDQLRAIIMTAWRPAWSSRRRVGCLTPLIAWWKKLRTATR